MLTNARGFTCTTLYLPVKVWSTFSCLTNCAYFVLGCEVSHGVSTCSAYAVVKSLGAVIGISVGCLAGMFPLLLTKYPTESDVRADAGGSDQKEGSPVTAAA